MTVKDEDSSSPPLTQSLAVPMGDSSNGNDAAQNNETSMTNSNNPTVITQSTTTSSEQVPSPQDTPTKPKGAGHSSSLELGRDPTKLVCPYCHQNMETVTEKKMGVAVLIAFILLLLLFWPLCWLPFCMPSCYDISHICPKCRAKVGVTKCCC